MGTLTPLQQQTPTAPQTADPIAPPDQTTGAADTMAATTNPMVQSNPTYQAFMKQLGLGADGIVAQAQASAAAPTPAAAPKPPTYNGGPLSAAAPPAAPAASDNPSLLADPAYAEYLRGYGLEKSTAEAGTAAQTDAINRALAERRVLLGQQNEQALGGINNAMETRGVFRSGENVSAQVKQQSAYGHEDAAAIADAADRKAALQQALQERLAGLERGKAEHALSTGQALALQDAASRIAAGGAQAQLAGTIGGTNSPAVVNSAMSWVGEPYQWGGGHGKVGAPHSSHVDCSGLVQQVFGENGIAITGTAADMQKKGTPIASLAQAQPGDLVFWGQPAHHVGIYIGNGQMIDAPHSGAQVRIEPVNGFGKDFAGIRRVA